MKRERELFGFSLILATLGAMAGFTSVKGVSFSEVLEPFAMTIAMLLVLGTVLGLERFQMLLGRKQLIAGFLSYLFSVMVISLVPENAIFNWWMAGPIVAALYIHPYFGIAFQEILTYLLCGLYDHSIESFIFYSIIGVILCVLTSFMTNVKSFVYVMIIALSSNLTLIFVMNNFAWKQATGESALYTLISTGAVIVIAYLLPHKRAVGEEFSETLAAGAVASESESEEKPAEEAAVEEKAVKDNDTVLLEILAESFPLRQRILDYSENLYNHSLHISSVAQEAALCVGCNDKIVQAGGLYHEVGRIQGKEYIDEGVKLGEEYALPQPVIDIIKQHNSKYEKPQSVEAAVVMITDSIVSTIEYMEKEQAGKKVQVAPEKIIDQIFDIRLAKGTLDESGMDIRNYKKLKEFFQKEYSKGGNG